MLLHSELGDKSFKTSRKLKRLIDANLIRLGGNKNLKIYGTISCKSGKRMNMKNRVFFENQQEAISNGYRPCGHCMRGRYLEWKARSDQLFDSQATPQVKNQVTLPTRKC